MGFSQKLEVEDETLRLNVPPGQDLCPQLPAQGLAGRHKPQPTNGARRECEVGWASQPPQRLREGRPPT